jgi:hypothetical protein
VVIRVDPGEHAIGEHLPGFADLPTEVKRLSLLCFGVGPVVGRRHEVRDQNAVDFVPEFRVLARVADLNQELDRLLASVRRRPRNEPVAARIDKHLEDLVTHVERPALRVTDERIRDPVAFVMGGDGAGGINVPLNEYLPMSGRYIRGRREHRDTRFDAVGFKNFVRPPDSPDLQGGSSK